MTTTEIGRLAEDTVAAHLSKIGFRIAAQNWRTRWCEIDIIATKKQAVYFVEVKYRSSNIWGDGLDAITPKKLEQMTFASQMWVQQNNWKDDCRLMVASVSGNPPQIDSLFEID